jgi:hypothetical protein
VRTVPKLNWQGFTMHKNAAADVKVITPERLMDLVPFFLGLDAYSKWRGETGKKGGQLYQKGLTLARRYTPILDAGVQMNLAPVLERPDAQIVKPAYRRSLRSGSPIERVHNKAGFLKALFSWFRARQTIFRSTFPGRAAKSGRQIMTIVDEESPASFVNRLSAIPPVSGLYAPRKWLKAAAEEMGAPLGMVEDTMVAVEAATSITTDIQKLDHEILNTTPNSEDAADLLSKKAALIDKLELHAQDSPNPTGLIQAAAAAAAPTSQSVSHQTVTGQKLGLNSQQEAAMVASGRKVIAAGAGSGKTRVLAGEIAYRINEQGTTPPP